MEKLEWLTELLEALTEMEKEAFMAGAAWGVADGAKAGEFLDMDYKNKVLNMAYKDWHEGN